MPEPHGRPSRQASETLPMGPTRPGWVERMPAPWRLRVAVLAALGVGVGAGAGGMLWWKAEPEPSPVRAHEHAVELVLFESGPRQVGGDRVLHVDGALLLSGENTVTVLGVSALDRSLVVRARVVPATVSSDSRLRSISLEIRVRSCADARGWTPGDRPFTIRWRDEWGEAHLDRAGDFAPAIARSLTRYVEEACA